MLSDGDFDGSDSDTENVPEVDLLEQLSKLQIGAQAETDETVSKASSKVLLRSNPVFDETRISSKVSKNSDCHPQWFFFDWTTSDSIVPENYRIHFGQTDRHR